MDIFTRCIRGWYLGRNLDQELTLTSLRRALSSGRQSQIRHSDQGIQYAAAAYVDLLTWHNVQVSMTEVGEAWQNGYAERLIRTIKEVEFEIQWQAQQLTLEGVH